MKVKCPNNKPMNVPCAGGPYNTSEPDGITTVDLDPCKLCDGTGEVEVEE